MQPDQYVPLAAQAMQADGCQVSAAVLPGGHAVVGYQSQFKLRWMATKIHLFTVLVATPVATPEGVQALTRDALDHAKRAKGSLRGLQTGVAVIPVLVSAQVTPAARALVQSSPKKEFAAFSLPAVVDLGTGEVLSYDKTPAVGALYYPWLRTRRRAALPAPPSVGWVPGAAPAPAPPVPPAPGPAAWPPSGRTWPS